jgi:flagellar assembly factor FliW
MNDVIPHASVLTFPDGIVGFEGARRFRLERPKDPRNPFALLRSLDDDASFLVVPPAEFFTDYDPDLDDAEGAVILVLVTVLDDVHGATANLLGPLVVDPVTLVGHQAVLDPDRWPAHRALVESPQHSG